LFGDEIANMYVPMDPPVSVENEIVSEDDLQVFPVPSKDKITIRLKNFAFPAKLTFYNDRGQQLYEMTVAKPEVSIDSARFFRAGLYLLKASDATKSVSRRIVLE